MELRRYKLFELVLLFVSMVDTVLIANILPYLEYYWPMQIPLSDYDVKLIMITAVISLVNIIIMTFRIN